MLNRVTIFPKVLQYMLFFVVLLFILEYLASTATVQFNHVVDAVGYYYFSKVPFFTVDFWLGMRPVGYPIFIKILDSNPNLVVAVQSLIYMLSWSFFAIYIFMRAKNKLFGLFSAVTILLIVIQPSVSAWTHHVLSESLTFTLLSWIFLFLYEFLISKKRIYLYSLILILVIYSTIRDVSSYYVATFTIVFLVLYLYKYINKYTFIIATTILLLSFSFSDYTANHCQDTVSDKTLTFKYEDKIIAHRWLFPYLNLVGHRFLTNSKLLNYMKNEGMPINDALLKKKHIWASPQWYSDPKLKDFRNWVAKSGKAKYAKFLITNPSYTFGELYQNRHQVFHYNEKETTWYYLKGYKTDNIFTYTNIKNITFYKYLFILLIIIILLSFILKRNVFNVKTITLLCLLIPIGLLSILTYHGDAMNVFRHTLIIPFLIKITLFMLVYSFTNELFKNIKFN